MTFLNPADYDDIAEKDELLIENVKEDLLDGDEFLTLKNLTKDHTYQVKHGLSLRQINIILEGGLLNYIRERGSASDVQREATAAAVGSTTAMPTKTTKVTESPGATPRPLSRAELFDQMVVERANRAVEAHDQLGHGLPEKTDRRMTDLLAPERGIRCLDIATASGTLAIALADRIGKDGKVDAIDLSPARLEFAERKARAHKVRNVEFKEMDAQHLEYDDDTFDLVACSLALFYFPDIPGALKEMYRVLKPGGRLAISTADPATVFTPLSGPYVEHLHKAAEELKLDPPAYSETAMLTRNEKGLGKLLKEAGFEHVDIKSDNIPISFSSFEDWWKHGRGSTWGDLLLDSMPEAQREAFKKKHREAIKPFFGDEGAEAHTPILFAFAEKPE
jgi:ubiquinone/menaquinone biosynthesis C-methylase UbiE